MKKLLFLLLFFVSPLFAAENAVVSRVVDGDTIKVMYNNQKISVRLIGIDTPESKNNAKARKDSQKTKQSVKAIVALGKQAAGFTGSLVKPGDTVSLEFDVQKYDRYQRILAYVYLANGKMLNEEIIGAGYASPMTIPPNVKYQDKFLKLYQQAREARRGLWK